MWPLSSHFPSHKANVPFVSLLRTPYIESRADPPPPHLLPKSIEGQDDICKHFCSKQESRNQHRDGCFGKSLPNLPHCLSALAPNRHSVRWQEAVKAQQQCPLLSPAWQQQMADLVPSLGTGVKGSALGRAMLSMVQGEKPPCTQLEVHMGKEGSSRLRGPSSWGSRDSIQHLCTRPAQLQLTQSGMCSLWRGVGG